MTAYQAVLRFKVTNGEGLNYLMSLCPGLCWCLLATFNYVVQLPAEEWENFIFCLSCFRFRAWMIVGSEVHCCFDRVFLNILDAAYVDR